MHDAASPRDQLKIISRPNGVKRNYSQSGGHGSFFLADSVIFLKRDVHAFLRFSSVDFFFFSFFFFFFWFTTMDITRRGGIHVHFARLQIVD